MIESIAIALGVNPSWFIGKSEEMELPSQKVPEIVRYYESLNTLGKEAAYQQEQAEKERKRAARQKARLGAR